VPHERLAHFVSRYDLEIRDLQVVRRNRTAASGFSADDPGPYRSKTPCRMLTDGAPAASPWGLASRRKKYMPLAACDPFVVRPFH
jgi:hypothetical protein